MDLTKRLKLRAAAPGGDLSSNASTVKGMSLRTNFSWTFVGNVIYSGCQWMMLAVLAKLGTPEIVGKFALGLAITAPVIMFTNLQLRVVQATDAHRKYVFGDYMGLRLLTTLLGMIAIIAITLGLGYSRETTLVVILVGVSKAFEAVSDVIYGLLQQREQMDRIAKSMIIRGGISMIALGLGLALTGCLMWGIVGMALIWGLVLIIYDIPSGKLILSYPDVVSPELLEDRSPALQTMQPHWNWRKLRELAILSLPLGLMMLLVSLNANIPRYFIEWHCGECELGIFAAMAYMMVAGRTVMFALGWSASPRLAMHYAKGEVSAFRSLMLKLVAVGVVVGGGALLVVVVAGKPILTLLYKPEYATYTREFDWITLAAGIGYVASLLSYGVTAAQSFKPQMVVLLVAAIATVATSYLLIPHRGLQGAADALLLEALVELGGMGLLILFAMRKLLDQQQASESSCG